MDKRELQRLAQIGAEAWINELQQQIDALRKQFPSAGTVRGKGGRARKNGNTRQAGAPVRTKRTISPEARERIRAGVRRRWAKWRKEQKAKRES